MVVVGSEGLLAQMIGSSRMKKSFLTSTRVFVLSVLLAAANMVALAQQPTRNRLPFSKGEELFYEAEFKKGLLRGASIGEFRFIVQSTPRDPNGADPLRLVADVVSKGFLMKLAGIRFHEHVESIIKPEQFSPLRTNKLDEQGKRVRVSDAVFDHDKRRVTWTERDPNQNQPPQITALDFTEPIQDILSMIYFVRTQSLDVGRSFDIPVSDSGRVFSLTVAVVERKRIKCALGRVEAVRIEPAMFGEGRMLRGEGKMSIWITEDSRHLPVWAHLNVSAGTVDIKLKRVSHQDAR
jgi:Protein of unknown function (DUF3108)